jgi:NADPH:quinone reductase-like Zn-dependent oxidoreductase
VGSIIVSAAHALGATVAGQTGHESNADWIKQRGADRVIVADADRLAGAVDETVPLAQVNEAFGRITERRSRGKIVLDTTD